MNQFQPQEKVVAPYRKRDIRSFLFERVPLKQCLNSIKGFEWSLQKKNSPDTIELKKGKNNGSRFGVPLNFGRRTRTHVPITTGLLLPIRRKNRMGSHMVEKPLFYLDNVSD